jgi:hypothetical protein
MSGKPGDSRFAVLEMRDRRNSRLDGTREGNKKRRRETYCIKILARQPLMFQAWSVHMQRP